MLPNTNVIVCLLSAFLASLVLTSAQRRTHRIISSPDIPVTSFSCTGRPPGYYADVETGCQVYHMCAEGGQQFSYKCPNTTLFQQRMLICAHWYQVNCSRSESHYVANLLIGQRDKPFVNENENTLNVNSKGKRVENLTNPEILQYLGSSGIATAQRFRQFDDQQTQSTTIKNNLKRSDAQFTGVREIIDQITASPLSTIGTQTAIFGANNFPTTKSQASTFSTNTLPTFKPIPAINSNIAPLVKQNTNLQILSSTGKRQEVTLNNAQSLRTGIPASPQILTTTNEPEEKSTTLQPEMMPNLPVQDQIELQAPTILSNTSEQSQPPGQPVDEYNVFINRFNPNEEAMTTTTESVDTTEYYSFINRFNPNVDSDGALLAAPSNGPEHRIKQTTLIKVPKFEFEPPLQDSDESDTNQIELHFSDPRRRFFIPESEEYSKVDEVPIVVTIPIHTSADSPPMWFRLNQSKDPCERCHPSFIVNKKNCMPCVIIR